MCSLLQYWHIVGGTIGVLVPVGEVRWDSPCSYLEEVLRGGKVVESVVMIREL